jgi:8-oxo-dGTP pyrophosphatase MutT (NUDIX family)
MNTFYIGVKAIVHSKETGDVLILEKSTPHTNGTQLDLPGGRIENNDDFIQTLKRELEEELGTSQENYTLPSAIPVGTSIAAYNIDNTAGLVLVYFEVVVENNFSPTLSSEHSSYKWYSRNDYTQLIAQNPLELQGSTRYIEQILQTTHH